MIKGNEAIGDKKQETKSSHLSWAERWESLKAGGIGAIAAGILFAVFTVINSQWILTQSNPSTNSYLTSFGSIMGVSGTIAILSGFLFAVTYHYVIRQDQNVHLKSGAVAAFGLVRGLAQLDIGLQSGISPLLLLALLLESLVLFAGVRIALDWAIARSKIRSF